MLGDIPNIWFLNPTIYDTTQRNLAVVIWLEELAPKPITRISSATTFSSPGAWRRDCMEWREQIESDLEANGRLGKLDIKLGRGLRTFTLSITDHGRDALAAINEGYVWDTTKRCVDIERTKKIWFGMLSHLKEGSEINRTYFDAIGAMNNPPIPELTTEATMTKMRVM